MENLEFDQVMSTSPFMDGIRDVCRSILLKQCEQIGASFIENRQMKMHEEIHG